MEALKASLSSEAASASTVARLQSLLGLEPIAQLSPSPLKPVGQSRSSRKPPTNSSARKRSRSQVIRVHEDRSQLSAKAKYGLATEVVNITLKVLSRPSKSGANASSIVQCTKKARGSTPASSHGSPASEGALQARSENTTPAKRSRHGDKTVRGNTSPAKVPTVAAHAPHIAPTAECARLGFLYLRSVDPQELGLRTLPALELENGMLALAGRLVALGLDTIAIKELRVLKRRLMRVASEEANMKQAKGFHGAAEPEKETLATLLQIKVDAKMKPGLLPLVVSYQTLVLKVITNSRKPAVVEACLPYLEIGSANSPASLITQQAENSKDLARAAKHLEALSQTLLYLCPSTAPANDRVAMDRSTSPAPAATLQLQTLALQIRRSWWEMAGHQANLEKELLDPFARCLSAFMRRSPATSTACDVYDMANASCERLELHEITKSSSVLFGINRTMVVLAEGMGKSAHSVVWAERMLGACTELEPDHARKAAALARLISVTKYEVPFQETDAFKTLEDVLRGQLNGHSADYDILIKELATMTQSLGTDSAQSSAIYLAAGFAQRYIRSYPGRSVKEAEVVILAAVRNSKSSEELLAWITGDAVKTFLESGVLRQVVALAATTPLRRCWSVSTEALSLSRVLQALTLRAIRSHSPGRAISSFDDAGLAPMERAALQELQLSYAIDLAYRMKYRTALQELLSDILRKLAALYTVEQHPLRRASITILVLRIQEEHPQLLPQHILKTWDNVMIDDPAQDAGLGAYTEDIKGSLQLCRAFRNGKPETATLRSTLVVWQRIIDAAESASDIASRVYDPQALLLQLKITTTYLAAWSKDASRLPLAHCIARLSRLSEASAGEQCEALIELAYLYIQLGFSEKACHALIEARGLTESQEVCSVQRLQLQVAESQYLLAIDNNQEAYGSLLEAKRLRDALGPDKIKREERKLYELCHARGWQVQSVYCLQTGAPRDALAAAKRSVKILNSVWSAAERQHDAVPVTELTDAGNMPDADHLITGVSKLHLTPVDGSNQKTLADGATFWPLVPLLCKALMHLADMYAHHGLFIEADYYSCRAVQIAESIGSDLWLSKVYTHRCQLLVLANRLEEAELCLAKCNSSETEPVSIGHLEMCQAQAAVRRSEGSFAEALELYQVCEGLLDQMQLIPYLSRIERYQSLDDDLAERTAALAMGSADPKIPPVPSRRTASQRRPAATKGAAKPTTVEPMSKRGANTRPVEAKPYLLSRLRAQLALDKARVLLDLKQDPAQALAVFDRFPNPLACTLRQRRVQFRSHMQRAMSVIDSDVSFNILPESTVSFPALITGARASSENDAHSEPCQLSVTQKQRVLVQRGRKKTAPAETLASILTAARDGLTNGHATSLQYGTTAEMHLECAMLSSITMLMSAAAPSQALQSFHPTREAMHIAQARINTLKCERAALCEPLIDEQTALCSWPAPSIDQLAQTLLTPAEYQERYIDILPEPWTAVSLSMDADCSELYITRHRSGQSPITLRIPFSRHKPEDEDDESQAFDYCAGKAELQDIVQASNYSCHNTGNLEVKGAKTNWWSEREALDKRLHELLTNIENIWLGGFKGVFSQAAIQPDLLVWFRRSFDEILARYLPSRKAAKGRTEHLALDDKVLELFIGLGNDEDGIIDLDEPLADLLYFVVDMLQFNGERNAYDEIDFDSMGVDVLDALRGYHEASPPAGRDRHLILLLDKRLQAFPWESLPCLEGASVSRLGSMLALRERIIAMRQCTSDLPRGYIVNRNSGTYFLNPAGDLAHTQTTLSPALSKLDPEWTRFTQREPNEVDFVSALTQSSMVLYFGHGAGSQYIRPRTIKKLDKCSEVIWLMGCSSGAVTEYGELEPFAVPLAYLLAGQTGNTVTDKIDQRDASMCMAVVATLWDVTDKDIDRFSLAVGEEWGLWPGSEASKLPAKTPSRRVRSAAPSTPQQVPKTPKTPQVKKTPAPAKTPARSRSRSGRHEDGSKRSLVEAVARSRDVCYLRYLNGAAPVVFGVPVYLGD